MFTVLKNKVYLIENEKIFPVNISIENGIEKVGAGIELPKTYEILTFNEIKVKFNIRIDKPYFYDKEKYIKDMAEAKAKADGK
ncbi:MAG: hypothetical protein ACI4U9_03620 [Clostridia bacterium]